MKQLKTDILVKTMKIVNPAQFKVTWKLNLLLPSFEGFKSLLLKIMRIVNPVKFYGAWKLNLKVSSLQGSKSLLPR